MMKQNKIKLILAAAALMLSVGAQAQSAQTFVNRYKQFVNQAWLDKDPSDRLIAYNDSVFDAMTIQYHSTYKPLMTSDQIEDYTEYRTRYLRQRASRKATRTGNKVADSASEAGEQVQSSGSKVGAKVNGFFRGLFSGSK